MFVSVYMYVHVCVDYRHTHVTMCVDNLMYQSSPSALFATADSKSPGSNFQGSLGLHLESHHKGAGITSTQYHVQLYVEW